MIDQKEVQLLIRAQFQGQKTLTDVSKSLGQIEANLNKQTDAAKRGESVIDELRATYAALQSVQAELANNAKLIGAFQGSADAIAKAEAKVAKTKSTYDEYFKTVEEGSTRTQTQQNKVIALQKAYDNAQKALAAQVTQQAQLRDTLSASGIAVDNLAAAERTLRDSAVATGAAMAKTDKAIKDYGDNVRIAREASAQLTKQQKESAAAAEMLARTREADRKREEQVAVLLNSSAQALYRKQQAEKEAIVTMGQRLLATLNLTKAEQDRKTAQEQAVRQDKDVGLAKTAQDADLAARGYITLARASTDLTPKVTALRDAVNAIINPGASARSTLSGVEDEIKSLGTTISAIKGPVSDYQALFKQLEQSQRSLAGKSDLIDNFRTQTAALRAARTEFAEARKKVTEYSDAVKQGGTTGDSFVRALAQSQTAARNAAQALNTQLNVTRQARDELRAAGIATNDLSSAEERLTRSTTQTVAATKQLTDAVDKYGNATERTKKGGGLFGDEGRTTLSYVQRLRGEVLSLVAAYVGLQGAQSLAMGAIQATSNRQASQTIIGVSLGTTDRKQIDEEYKYVKDQSERIGLVFEDTVKQYGKFATAAAKSGRSRQEIKFIFEAFAEGGRVLGLTTDNLNGVFLALEQIFSKGKLGAEELRQQLGERLPGVFEVAQKALKSQFPDLNKAMEQGKVGAEQLVLIAQEYRKLVAEQLPGATKGIVAEQARLSNAVNDFKLAIADAGWADTYAKALGRITEFLKSADGQKFAESASKAFTALANGLILALENFDAIKGALEAFILIASANWAAKAILNFAAMSAAAKATAVDFRSATGIMQAAIGVFTAAVVGWEIGTYLYNKFRVVRDAGTYLVTGLEIAWVTIRESFAAAFEVLPDIAYNAFAAVVNSITLLARKLTGVFSGIAKAAGFDQLSAALDKAVEAATLPTRNIDAAIASRKAKLQAEIGAIKKIREDMLADNDREIAAKTASPTAGGPTPFPGFTPDKKGPSDGDIKKRENEVEAITRALEALDAKIDRTQTKNLAKQLEAVDEQYAALERRIKKLGGKEGAQFQAQLDKATLEYKEQITKKFNDDLLKEQESVQKKLESLDAAAGRKNKGDLDARLAAVSSTYESTYREIAAFRETLLANKRDPAIADEQKQRLDAGVAELKQLETQKFYNDQIVNKQTELRNLIDARTASIKTQNDLAEGSLITEAQKRENIKNIVAATQPEIEAVAGASLQLVGSLQGIANSSALQRLSADAQLAVASGQQLTKTFQVTGKQIEDSITAGATTAFDTLGKSIADVANGTLSLSDGFRQAAAGFLNFAADFLKQIALMIIKQQILNSLQTSSGGGGFISSIVGLVNGAVKHDGGVVGSSGRSRSGLHPSMFANVPRYHSGGIPNLASDEYATILQKNEEVLSKDDPRNILNGGGKPAAGGQTDAGTRIVILDDKAKVPEAMASAQGEKTVLRILRQNAATVRAYLK